MDESMAAKKTTSAALQYLDPSFFEHSPKHRAALEEARASQEIAQLVSQLRGGAGMSLRELARAAGLTPKTLEKLESGANPRLAFTQLRAVAAALGQRVQVRLVSDGRRKKRASAKPRKAPRARAASPLEGAGPCATEGRKRLV
ncbi:MAG: XRE family transcriptional regulator [Planctomycetes bacterium]|nr:XRE family transcriptional regulator [Planctomycetota bacterium]